ADFPIAAAYIAPGTADTAALNQAVAGLGARVESRAVWIEGTASTAFRASWLGLLAALGISLVYSLIAIANTMVMAAAGRYRELAVLRLTGATARQALAAVAGETALVVVVGVVLAALATVVDLAGLSVALSRLTTDVVITVPWPTVATVAGVSFAVAMAAAVLTAAAGARSRAAMPE
ncbi:FtsX-like permease family protein, partial [Amycolatopsis sp. NPDC000746]